MILNIILWKYPTSLLLIDTRAYPPMVLPVLRRMDGITGGAQSWSGLFPWARLDSLQILYLQLSPSGASQLSWRLGVALPYQVTRVRKLVEFLKFSRAEIRTEKCTSPGSGNVFFLTSGWTWINPDLIKMSVLVQLDQILNPCTDSSNS